MALNYSVSLRTNPIKKDEPAKAYATAQINGELSLKQLSRRVSMQTTVSRADVVAVLISLTGYFETYARCRIPTRFAQTGMLLTLATVSSLDARPLRPSKGKRSFPLISAGISLFNSLFTINY